MLAGDTGFYDDYDSYHHNVYHQATIAHNSIVVYNGNTAHGQLTGLYLNDSMSYSDWKNGKDSTYKTATLDGVSYKYDANGKPKYAYIAGDISNQYYELTTNEIFGSIIQTKGSKLLDKADRRMLSIFNTQNPDVPMYFFVYDNVTTKKTNYQTTFLRHTAAEPTINGNTVTVTSNSNKKTGGQLVLQNVKGGSSITKIGGTNNNYVVNGSQVATSGGENDCYWGRVEIKVATGSTSQVMLNVMYVTDNGKTLSLPAMGFETDKVDGAAIGNTVGVFLKNTTNNTDNITFTAPNTGSGSKVFYYVSGMADGQWTIKCGTQIINITLDEDDGG